MKIRLWALLVLSCVAAGCSTGKERLEAAGATVTESNVSRQGRVVDARNVRVGPEASLDAVLDAAETADYVYSVTVEGQPVNCEQMQRLAALPDLRGLSLRNTQTPAECLAPFHRSRLMRSFATEGLEYTTDDLKWLGELLALSTVAVPGSKIDDAFGEALRPVQTLERVIVSDTPVGDAFVASIAANPNLKQLGVDRTNVTAAGLMPLAESRSIERIHATHLKPDEVMDFLDAAVKLEEIVLDSTETEARSASQRNKRGVRVLTPEQGGTLKI